MPRIKSRPIREVIWDLNRAVQLGPKIIGCTKMIETELAKKISSMVAGCFELLTAELLSHKVELREVAYDEPIRPPCVYWNGRLLEEIPASAPSGVADIEIYLDLKETWIVDVTLSSDSKTQMFEARRLMAHNPSSTASPNIKRVLVAPRINVKHQHIIPIEMKSEIKKLSPERPKAISYWEKVETTIRAIIGN
ncbi:MAG: hypothetical protein QXD53_07165 [Candidatus Bathyarchaeia archaeon]